MNKEREIHLVNKWGRDRKFLRTLGYTDDELDREERCWDLAEKWWAEYEAGEITNQDLWGRAWDYLVRDEQEGLALQFALNRIRVEKEREHKLANQFR